MSKHKEDDFDYDFTKKMYPVRLDEDAQISKNYIKDYMDNRWKKAMSLKAADTSRMSKNSAREKNKNKKDDKVWNINDDLSNIWEYSFSRRRKSRKSRKGSKKGRKGSKGRKSRRVIN